MDDPRAMMCNYCGMHIAPGDEHKHEHGKDIHIEKLQARIEELKGENARLRNRNRPVDEAVKEMAAEEVDRVREEAARSNAIMRGVADAAKAQIAALVEAGNAMEADIECHCVGSPSGYVCPPCIAMNGWRKAVEEAKP